MPREYNYVEAQAELRKKQEGLLVAYDKENNVSSKFEVHPQTGKPIFRRDATKASTPPLPLAPDKNTNLIKNNTLARTLGTLRGVLHVLNALPNKEIANKVGQKLLSDFENFEASVNAAYEEYQTEPKKLQKALQALEAKFNLNLLKALNKPGIDLLKGIEKKPKEQNKLLSYCRFAAGSLDPAPIVETQSNIGNPPRIYTEICYPLTEKTAQQKGKLAEIPTDDKSTGPKFYIAMSQAEQAVTRAFRAEFMDDDKGLSSQMRLYIPWGVKHAFATERRFSSPDGNDSRSVWSARSATLAYVGKRQGAEAAMGGSSELQAATHENLAQLRKNIGNVIHTYGNVGQPPSIAIHVSMLNTDTKDENRQDLMVRTTETAIHAANEAAMKEARKAAAMKIASEAYINIIASGGSTEDASKAYSQALEDTTLDLNTDLKVARDAFSYTPVNPQGRFHRTRINPQYAPHTADSWSNPLSPVSSAEQAARVGVEALTQQLQAAATPGNNPNQREINEFLIALSTCASGCDRTGTSEFMRSVFLMMEQDKNLTLEEVQKMWVLSGHNQVMANIYCPGSPGLKTDSRPGNWFGEDSKRMYFGAAKTNKEIVLGYKNSEGILEKSMWALIITSVTFVALPLLLHHILSKTVGSDFSFLEMLLKPILTSPALVAVGPGLIFTLGGIALLIGLILAFEKFRKDWISGVAISLLMMGAILTIGLTAPLVSGVPLLVMAWHALAAATTLLGPITILALISAIVLALVWLACDKTMDKIAEKDFIAQLAEDRSQSQYSAKLEGVGYPHFAASLLSADYSKVDSPQQQKQDQELEQDQGQEQSVIPMVLSSPTLESAPLASPAIPSIFTSSAQPGKNEPSPTTPTC